MVREGASDLPGHEATSARAFLQGPRCGGAAPLLPAPDLRAGREADGLLHAALRGRGPPPLDDQGGGWAHRG